MEQLPTTLKITFKKDIRRLPFTIKDFSSFKKQVAELFSVEEDSFIIKYKDDEEDLITLSSNEELKEAISCCNEKVMRLTIFTNNLKNREEVKKEELPRRRGGCRRRCGRNRGDKSEMSPFVKMIGPIIQQFGGQFLEGGNLDGILKNLVNTDFCKVEQNYICDGCDTPICGSRFHCTGGCEDFDFCESCYNDKKESHNSEHKFEEISAVDALKSALNNKGILIDSFLCSGKATEPLPKKLHNAICDRCDSKIVGIRWKCFECPDFDFCNSCYLEANGKESIKEHKKEHSFAKIDEPENIKQFPSYLIQFKKNKEEQEEKEKLLEVEKKKKLIEERLKEEKRQLQQLEEKLQKEREEFLKSSSFELIEKPKEEKPKEEVKLEILEPIIEKAKEEKPKQELKIVYPFEEKIEALNSMGFYDRETNIKLLVKHKGELLPVIQELLQN